MTGRETPNLAVAVSGGADSMALAVLARDWSRDRGLSVAALVVDHGLRPDSADEAAVTINRLGHLGIPARLLRLTALQRGSALAERARIMRYQVLCDACRDAGCRHLLLGHHAGDQIETVAMRALRGSHTHGLAGMAGMHTMNDITLLRPLLGIAPASLRRYLTERDIAWVEDPSNHDLRALRPRLRHLLADHMPASATLRLLDAIAAIGRIRAIEAIETAAELAARAVIRPEGFALLSPGRISEAALSRLLQTIGGAAYPPALPRIAELAADLRAATVAGVRIMPAGRFGRGWLVLREEAAIAAPVPAAPGAVWDHRFRLIIQRGSLTGATIGKLGDDSARVRRLTKLPSAVLRTLPAVRFGKIVAAVPHLGYELREDDVQMTILFASAHSDPCFVPGA
jgi:tRNA(Ile)-lysidine synthase